MYCTEASWIVIPSTPISRSALRRWLPVLVAAGLYVWPLSHARAGGPIGPNGAPIQTSSYTLDLFQGPVFAGSRVTGLAGAYVAIAEDVDGDLQNPAAPAVRPFYSYSYFDYWLGLGLTFPATLKGIDFFNEGTDTKVRNSPRSFVFFVPAANLQWGDLGLGATLEMQHYELANTTRDGTADLRVTIPTTHLQAAYGLFHNQWVFGVGVRLASLYVASGLPTTSAVFASTGTGVELGMVWKPERRPFRVGLAFRSAIRTEARYSDDLLPDSQGDLVIPDGGDSPLYLPRSVALPWDLNLGVAVQFGKRPLNPPWRTLEELVEREYLKHRLRELEREDKRSAALALAKTPAQRSAIAEAFDREQQADDRALERDRRRAVQRVEAALQAINRFYVQVSASLVVTGPVEGAVSVESLLSQVVNRSGGQTAFSPRLGIEVSAIPTWLRVRGGSYLEPTRVETSTPRLHGTLGLDVRLLRWNVLGLWPDDYMWRLGLGVDAARDYFVWGVTLGGWYPRRTGVTDDRGAPPPLAQLSRW